MGVGARGARGVGVGGVMTSAPLPCYYKGVMCVEVDNGICSVWEAFRVTYSF